ncbi:hypothetical protein BDP27DRAFT_181176 [Rhodocollybia butyracea]|uniref:F-box domain-containing protein n=1 Tax=Rhodocollybia butyracea TaxID=206335 RepID=A0A9P5PLG0_9AGAR|nr:hypothetical protein BDP27DRAFT_181176 [Rhodocollybia butyracea]
MNSRGDSERHCRKCKVGSPTPRVSPDTITSMRKYLRLEGAISDYQTKDVVRTLDDIQSDIADYSTEISRLEARILTLNVKRNFLEHYAEPVGLSILAPIRKLPSEILSEIFAQCGSYGNSIARKKSFDMSRQPAWAVSSTCSRWRRIALSCKPLWSNIRLDLHGTHVASSKAEYFAVLALNRCLHLSHPHPLTLRTKSSLSDVTQTGMSLVRSLILHADRWQDLTIVNNESQVEVLPSDIRSSIQLPLYKHSVLKPLIPCWVYKHLSARQSFDISHWMEDYRTLRFHSHGANSRASISSISMALYLLRSVHVATSNL